MISWPRQVLGSLPEPFPVCALLGGQQRCPPSVYCASITGGQRGGMVSPPLMQKPSAIPGECLETR